MIIFFKKSLYVKLKPVLRSNFDFHPYFFAKLEFNFFLGVPLGLFVSNFTFKSELIFLI